MKKSKIKFRKSIFKSKAFLSVFLSAFAVIGTYALIHSFALVSGNSRISVIVAQRDTNGNISSGMGAAVTVSTNQNNLPSNYNCSDASGNTYQDNRATADASGRANFNCQAPAGGTTFYLSASKADYSPGSANTYLSPNQTQQVIINLQLIDSDGDNIGDSRDACPNAPGPYNGCPGAQIVSFSASPTTVYAGSSSTLSWNTSNARGCTLTGGDGKGPAGPGSVQPSGSWKPTFTTASVTPSYNLLCYNQDGSTGPNKYVTITVVNAPAPTDTGTSTGGRGGTSSTSSTSKAAAKPKTNSSPVVIKDTTPPSKPGNLLATQYDIGSIELSWDNSTDDVGVAGYNVERSEDQTNWTKLDSTDSNSFTDSDIKFATHYYYKITAFDDAGNVSEPGTIDITSDGFKANVTADQGVTLKSEDGVVTAKIAAGSFDEDAFCQINEEKIGSTPKGLKLVTGGYIISCKNSASDDLTDFNNPVEITMALKAFKAFKGFKAYSSSDSGLSMINASLDKSNSKLSFKQSKAEVFAAFGAKKCHGLLFWLLLPLILLFAIVMLLLYRRSRPDEPFYDTASYTAPPMPPIQPTPGPLPEPGYQHHTSLPEMVAQAQQQNQAPIEPPAGPPQQPIIQQRPIVQPPGSPAQETAPPVQTPEQPASAPQPPSQPSQEYEVHISHNKSGQK